jgi:hypothetical protein
MPFPEDPHPILGETDAEFEKRLLEWQRNCMGGPTGWKICAAALALTLLYVLLR